MPAIGTHTGVGRRRNVVLGGSSSAGAFPTGFALAPTSHYHPASQTATLDGSNRVLSCPDLLGLAALSGISFAAATVGPTQMTDALGRKFWRFEGTAYLLVGNALNALSARAVAVMALIRHHRSASLNIFSPRYSAYTDDATNATYTSGSTLRALASSGSAPMLHGAGIGAASARHLTGSQLQVAGIASRTTANGGQRIYLNNDAVNVAQSGVTFTSCTGGVIGGIPAASNAVAASNNFMDLYELAIWKGELTNAQADAAAAAMVSNWAIPAVTNSLLLEGDSITQGTGGVTSGINIAMQLTAPGGTFSIPASWRVVNQGIAGNVVADVLTRRNAVNGAASLMLPGGRNVLVCQIGRNDLGASRTGAAIYADIVTLLNTTSTGFLQRGWEVRQAINIAVSAAIVAENTALRTALRNTAQFQADTLSAAGDAFEGKTGIIDLPAWTVAGNPIFDTTTDALDGAWYAGDTTHPNAAGATEMAKAYAAGLALS